MQVKLSVENSSLLRRYELFLTEDERSENTIQKYLRDVKKFMCFVADTNASNKIQKINVLDFKVHLLAQYAPASVNSMLAAINHFLSWQGLESCKVKPLKIQKDTFSRAEKELTQREYQRLLTTAEERGNHKLSLLIQTICATGIRVSELCYITVQAVKDGKTRVRCKGKNRTIFLPKELCKRLKQYCEKQRITSGIVFKTKSGAAMNRSNIWKMMKRLCVQANVKKEKVFPHNLRHLFAQTYYKTEKDIARLADILGHTNVNTTRIYTMESGRKHAMQINRMNLLYQGAVKSSV